MMPPQPTSIFKTAILLSLSLLIVTPAHSNGLESYCDGYLNVLTEAVSNRREGYPNYADSLIQEEWRDDVDFIFKQPRGFNYRDWVNERYRKCWEETPYGPKK